MKIAYCVIRDGPWRDRKIPSANAASLVARTGWDATFAMSWVMFRIRLNAIRVAHAAKYLGFDEMIESESRDFLRISKEPGWLIVNSDEDDWHDPEIAIRLREVPDTAPVVRWEYARTSPYGTWLRAADHPEAAKYPYYANNWATATPLVCNLHDLTIAARYPLGTEHYLAGHHSLHNFTVGSISRLDHYLKHEPASYPQRITTEAELMIANAECPGPQYADAYQQLVSLHRELLVSRRCRFRRGVTCI